MTKNHFVIIIPGLGDNAKEVRWATSHWRRYGLKPVIHSVGWNDKEADFRPKLERLTGLIDKLSSEGDKVSIVGLSAGGSAAINAYIRRRKKVNKTVSVCGRLIRGNQTGFRSFEKRTASSSAFAQSILLCESGLTNLTNMEKRKIMTVRAMFGDELVPAETAIVKGADNIAVPTAEHVLSIGATLTIFSKPVILFLKER